MNHKECQTDPCYDVIQCLNQELSIEQNKMKHLEEQNKQYEMDLARSLFIHNTYHYILPLYLNCKSHLYLHDVRQFKNIPIQPYEINDITRINKSKCNNLLLDIKETRYLSDTIGRRNHDHTIDYELMGKDLLLEVLDNKYSRDLWQ